MSSGSFKNVIYKICLEMIYSIYMYKKYLALNNLKWLIYHKINPNETIQLDQGSTKPYWKIYLIQFEIFILIINQRNTYIFVWSFMRKVNT